MLGSRKNCKNLKSLNIILIFFSNLKIIYYRMRKINVNFEITNFIINKGSKDLIKTIRKNIHFLNNNKNNYNKIFSLYLKNRIPLFKIHIENFSEKESHKLDPYLILEVNRGAEFKIIKAAYFKLARLYHPDTNKNDEVKSFLVQIFLD